jgi:hypothetical protein
VPQLPADNCNEPSDLRMVSRARRAHGNVKKSGSPLSPLARAFAAFCAAALLIGAGIAAAAVVPTSSQTLADGSVSCFFTTGSPNSSDTPDYRGAAVGESPYTYCASIDRLNAHTGVPARSVRFIGCEAGATSVDVYVADGSPDQCQRLGERPLPASYPAPVARLRALTLRLDSIQAHRACQSPQRLASGVRSALTQLEFDDWRIVLPPAHPSPKMLNSPAGTGGICGSLISVPAANAPDREVQLLPNSEAVTVTLGPPRAISSFAFRTTERLYQQTYGRCYTALTARALIRRAFAPESFEACFATYSLTKERRLSAGLRAAVPERVCPIFQRLRR